jgi:hypothetical protein
MAEGFLGRWAQRKADARQGLPLTEPVPAVALKLAPKPPESASVLASAETSAQLDAAEAPLLPTLLDAQALTPESDFKPFMARAVSPEVKNAAMKKLFADPHYNVMDRLDIYIDDYSRSDPIPESMLRQMVSAKFLNLFEEKDEPPEAVAAADAAACAPLATPTGSTTHDDPDLRLQPDHAPGPQGPGRGAE